jgi:hypothetical protein
VIGGEFVEGLLFASAVLQRTLFPIQRASFKGTTQLVRTYLLMYHYLLERALARTIDRSIPNQSPHAASRILVRNVMISSELA